MRIHLTIIHIRNTFVYLKFYQLLCGLLEMVRCNILDITNPLILKIFYGLPCCHQISSDNAFCQQHFPASCTAQYLY